LIITCNKCGKTWECKRKECEIDPEICRVCLECMAKDVLLRLGSTPTLEWAIKDVREANPDCFPKITDNREKVNFT
jgi:hypothetical protein